MTTYQITIHFIDGNTLRRQVDCCPYTGFDDNLREPVIRIGSGTWRASLIKGYEVYEQREPEKTTTTA